MLVVNVVAAVAAVAVTGEAAKAAAAAEAASVTVAVALRIPTATVKTSRRIYERGPRQQYARVPLQRLLYT